MVLKRIRKVVWGGVGLVLYNSMAVFTGCAPLALSAANLLIVMLFGIPGVIAIATYQIFLQK